jgi:hypothetical protein
VLGLRCNNSAYPADVFVFGTAFGGASLYKTALVAGFSSAFGGATGFYVVVFGPWRFRRIFGSKILRTGINFIKSWCISNFCGRSFAGSIFGCLLDRRNLWNAKLK